VEFADGHLREARHHVKTLVSFVEEYRQHACTACRAAADPRIAELDWKKVAGYSSVFSWLKTQLPAGVGFRLRLRGCSQLPAAKKPRKESGDASAEAPAASAIVAASAAAASVGSKAVLASAAELAGSALSKEEPACRSGDPPNAFPGLLPGSSVSAAAASVGGSLKSWLVVRALSLQRQGAKSAGEQGERYVVQEPDFGQGSFGVVAGAWDKRGQLRICLKRQKKTDFPEFLKELSVLAGLAHPNVVEILDAFVHPVPTLVLAAAGESLKACITKGPIAASTTARLMLQLLEGLAYLASRLVIHSDLKPGNVCVDGEGRLRIIDFGCALISMDGFRSNHSAKEIAEDGLLYTTLPYRAPEILLGDGNFSFPADVWSAGCIWAELLTGKGLFEDETTAIGTLLRIIRVIGSPQGDSLQCLAALPLWSAKFPVWAGGSLSADLGSVPPGVLAEVRSALALAPFARKSAAGLVEVFKAGNFAAEPIPAAKVDDFAPAVLGETAAFHAPAVPAMVVISPAIGPLLMTPVVSQRASSSPIKRGGGMARNPLQRCRERRLRESWLRAGPKPSGGPRACRTYCFCIFANRISIAFCL
jgi:hypothetical protein